MTLARIAAALVVAGLVACTGGGPSATPSSPSDPRASRRTVRAAADPELRTARMQVATVWRDGGLASFCRAEECTEDPSVRPDGFARAERSEVVAFFVARRPTGAEVSFTRAGSRKVVWTARPHLATFMAVEHRLPPGRYLVTLTARWGAREARWLFGLRVEE